MTDHLFKDEPAPDMELRGVDSQVQAATMAQVATRLDRLVRCEDLSATARLHGLAALDRLPPPPMTHPSNTPELNGDPGEELRDLLRVIAALGPAVFLDTGIRDAARHLRHALAGL